MMNNKTKEEIVYLINEIEDEDLLIGIKNVIIAAVESKKRRC